LQSDTPLVGENSKGKYLSQGQERMIRSALVNILTNAETLESVTTTTACFVVSGQRMSATTYCYAWGERTR